MMERSTGERRLPAPGPAAARAAISPLGLVAAAIGAAAGLAITSDPVTIVILGVGLWGTRVAAAAVRAAGRQRRARRPEAMDPYAVPDPWRTFVRDALTAQTKFDQAVTRSRPGPLRDRLASVSVRVHDGVRECWRVAHLGAALGAALGALNPDGTSSELRRFQEIRAQTPALAGEAAQAADDTEAAMATQLQAARRVQAAAQRTTDRLRVLTAELNAAVASAVELSLDATDAAAANELAGSVDSVVGEIESLRLALEEAATAGQTAPSIQP